MFRRMRSMNGLKDLTTVTGYWPTDIFNKLPLALGLPYHLV
jgi:hypothetical protein